MILVLLIFCFSMFGNFEKVDTYIVKDVAEAKYIIERETKATPGIFNGEPPSKIAKLYESNFTFDGRIIKDISDQIK